MIPGDIFIIINFALLIVIILILLQLTSSHAKACEVPTFISRGRVTAPLMAPAKLSP